ncbi:MAG: PilZ domain-containing protein [Epsilonproteobacteria bacterium]|nr:PilZ domain-containing protein [Campylobacterota bacterium]
MSLSQLYTKARAFQLTCEELEFIIFYSKKLGIETERVLVNKELFQRLVQSYMEGSLKPDEQMVEGLRYKLGFVNPVEATFRSTSDLHRGLRALFSLDRDRSSPIELERNRPDYLLWRVLSHRNMDLLREGVEGTIFLEDRYKREYRFRTRILNELRQNLILIRTPHAQEIELLQSRRYPRVAVGGEASVRLLGREGREEAVRYRLCNISKGGLKLCALDSVGEGLLSHHDRLVVEFGIDGTPVKGVAKVVYSGPDGYYGVMFEELDARSLRAIEGYIARRLDPL